VTAAAFRVDLCNPGMTESMRGEIQREERFNVRRFTKACCNLCKLSHTSSSHQTWPGHLRATPRVARHAGIQRLAGVALSATLDGWEGEGRGLGWLQ
jgi:hypothetical protein